MTPKQMRKIQNLAKQNLQKGKGKAVGRNSSIDIPGEKSESVFMQVENAKAEARKKAEKAALMGHTSALDRLDIIEGTRDKWVLNQRVRLG